MKKYNNIVLAFILSLFCSQTFGYVIRGKINLGDIWENKIYLCDIQSINNFYAASQDFIINKAVIDSNGFFEIKGNNLTDENTICRLSLTMKGENSNGVSIRVGGRYENFIVLILNNHSDIYLTADGRDYSGTYTTKGSADNVLIKQLRAIREAYYLLADEISANYDPNEENKKLAEKLKNDWIQLHQKKKIDIKNFIDTTPNIIAAIIATQYYNPVDSNYHYFKLLDDRFLEKLPNSKYVQQFHNNVVDYERKSGIESQKIIWIAAFGIIVIVIVMFLWLFWQKKKYLAKIEALKTLNADKYKNKITEELTLKEQKVLQLITEGKSNKEIAQELFVELSTIKTHVNNIYSKLNLKNRKEAIITGKSLTSK